MFLKTELLAEKNTFFLGLVRKKYKSKQIKLENIN